MRVDVVMAVAGGSVVRRTVALPATASVRDALSAANMAVPDGGVATVFGRIRSLESAVTDGERVEICLPLAADPKQARRSRARRRANPGR